MKKQVIATYLIETAYSLEHAAQVMAGEQSTGTFLALPGETEKIKQEHGAEIISIKEIETVSSPSLPGAKVPDGSIANYHRGEVILSFPYHNFGPSIPNLLATITGNLYELEEFSGLRLMDIDLPIDFTENYLGPQFGIEGTRSLTGVTERPIIGTIIKPNIGLKPEELRPLVRELALAGIDFIKDDEINGNPPFAPLKDRIKVVMEEIERAADITGKKTMYAFNITDDIENLHHNHDLVVEAGGNCVMVSINSIGYSGLSYLRKHSQVPIHGHRNQWGLMTRHPYLGIDFTAYQKLCRLVGVDHLHVNGLNSKFYDSNESVIKSVSDCLKPMFNGYEALPVLSSKQWAGQAPVTYEKLKTIDIMNIAGGGIHAHPSGPAAGFRSMIQGWEAAMAGIPLNKYAEKNQELKEALIKFGKG
ncbi:ribulose 1,5-bisphosphate carboxylase [Aquibacillus halophilus]|uniref:Ribulose 1,5-bisphosphate carboxylase n=1 Tax=Aquibacillus halophilus TaxID=930132 RepID=A0A6A8D6P1_9BACI|nr:ribulose-bisphosphate carboxylase large subunit family protein [Aquibacillus halophilus]MRH41248.1 ribulose 1,5-bisphosphate carboxylase [Aquibacillus halophilus]